MARFINDPQWISTEYHRFEVVMWDTRPICEDNITMDCKKYVVGL